MSKTNTKIITGNYVFVSSGKWIPIKYNLKNNPYFMLNGRRAYLSDFPRTNSMWSSQKELHEVGLHAYDARDSYNPAYIEVSDDSEAVKVWRYNMRNRPDGD